MRATFHAFLCASALAGLLVLPACTQDQAASTAERDTHMGAAGHEVEAAPPLPAAVNPPPPPTAAAPAPAPMPVAAAAPADAGGDAAPSKAGDAGAAAAAPAKPKHK